jgi:hypothetical protein
VFGPVFLPQLTHEPHPLLSVPLNPLAGYDSGLRSSFPTEPACFSALLALESLNSLADRITYFALCWLLGHGQGELLHLQSRFRDLLQICRGKFDRLRYATAGSTASELDGYGPCNHKPARPSPQDSYPFLVLLVHRRASLLYASFRPRLATTPLRLTNPSPPSGWGEEPPLQTFEDAQHTK